MTTPVTVPVYSCAHSNGESEMTRRIGQNQPESHNYKISLWMTSCLSRQSHGAYETKSNKSVNFPRTFVTKLLCPLVLQAEEVGDPCRTIEVRTLAMAKTLLLASLQLRFVRSAMSKT